MGKLHKQGHSWRQWILALTEVFVEKLKFTTPDIQQLHQGLPPQYYQHRPGENGYNLDQKNTPLTVFLLLGTKITEISHGLEKIENIWIQNYFESEKWQSW